MQMLRFSNNKERNENELKTYLGKIYNKRIVLNKHYRWRNLMN